MKLSKGNKCKLIAYLLVDRQWKREHRVAYARHMIKFAVAKKDAELIAFWDAVLEANAAEEIPLRKWWMGGR